jgi:hypothetical protein
MGSSGRWSDRGRSLRDIAFLLSALIAVVCAPPACARHRARKDPAEPIFTQRPFIEKDLELDLGWERHGDADTVQPTLGNTWVFRHRLETTVEVPFEVRVPRDHAPAVGGLSDVTFGLQVLLCCQPGQPLDYLSVRGEVETPTGSRRKDLGGTGGFTLSVLPGRLVTVVESLPDLFVQVQLAYAQEIRSSAEELATAVRLGRSATREKDFVWNLAGTQTYLDGRVRPVVELLGTTVLDAADPDDEGTIVELAGGLWIAPFYDEHWLAPVSVGMGYRWPVTGRHDALMAALLIVEWAFD